MSDLLTLEIEQSDSLQSLMEVLKEQYDSGDCVSPHIETAIVKRINTGYIREELKSQIANADGNLTDDFVKLFRLVPDDGPLHSLLKEIIEEAQREKNEAENNKTSEFFPT